MCIWERNRVRGRQTDRQTDRQVEYNLFHGKVWAVLRLYLRESIWGEMGGPEAVPEGEYMGRDGRS